MTAHAARARRLEAEARELERGIAFLSHADRIKALDRIDALRKARADCLRLDAAGRAERRVTVHCIGGNVA